MPENIQQKSHSMRNSGRGPDRHRKADLMARASRSDDDLATVTISLLSRFHARLASNEIPYRNSNGDKRSTKYRCRCRDESDETTTAMSDV